jgi:transcriptional regulator GlxA family with amidase domain
MSVTDAAASCGFKDISYFSKTFKRIKGKNPSEIKNKADV